MILSNKVTFKIDLKNDGGYLTGRVEAMTICSWLIFSLFKYMHKVNNISFEIETEK